MPQTPRKRADSLQTPRSREAQTSSLARYECGPLSFGKGVDDYQRHVVFDHAVALENARERGFYEAKIATARFFMRRLLPQTSSLVGAIMSGSEPIMELDAEAF